MSTQAERARHLRELHDKPPLVLPNAWDAGSARAIESAGAAAIATTSAGIAWSLGVADGGGLTLPAAAGALRAIVAAVAVPVTADIEAGYGDVAAAVTAVLEAGAVGINLEDSTHGVLDPPEVHADRISTARATAVALGIDLVINARVDTHMFGDGTGTLVRAHVYAEAGADVLFVPAVTDAPTIRSLAADSPLPLNIMAGPGSPSIPELVDLGVTRISLGPALTTRAYAVATAATTELLTTGTYTTLT